MLWIGGVQWMNLGNGFQRARGHFSETMLIRSVACPSEAILLIPRFHITEHGADKRWAIWGCGVMMATHSPQEQTRCLWRCCCGVCSPAASTNLSCFLPSGWAAQEDARVPRVVVPSYSLLMGRFPGKWGLGCSIRQNYKLVVALEVHSQARAAEHELNLLISVEKWSESSRPRGLCASGSLCCWLLWWRVTVSLSVLL